MADFFTPEQYGAVGNGSADDTIPLQNMLNAMVANGGGTVLFKRASYLISQLTLPANSPPITWLGAGHATNSNQGTAFILTSGNADGFVFGSSTTASTGLTIKGIRIDASARTGGYAINLQRYTRLRFENVVIANPFNGINNFGFNQTNFYDVVIAAGRGTRGFNFTGDDSFRFNVATCYSCDVSGVDSNKTINAFVIDGAGGTVSLYDSIAVNCFRGLLVTNTLGTTGNPSFIWCYGFQTDFAQQDGIRIEVGSNLYLSNTYSHGSAAGRGLSMLSPVLNLQINGGNFTGNSGDGIYLAGQEVEISNGAIATNSLGSANVADGIRIASTAKYVSIVGSRVGRRAGNSGNQRYGIRVDAGATAIIAVANDLNGNLTAGLSNAAGTALTQSSNIG